MFFLKKKVRFLGIIPKAIIFIYNKKQYCFNIIYITEIKFNKKNNIVVINYE